MAKIRLLNNLTGEHIEYDAPEQKNIEQPVIEQPAPSIDQLQARISELEGEIAKVKADAGIVRAERVRIEAAAEVK